MDGEDISPKYFRLGEVTGHFVRKQNLIGKKIRGASDGIHEHIHASCTVWPREVFFGKGMLSCEQPKHRGKQISGRSVAKDFQGRVIVSVSVQAEFA